jgi:hypothetical protein
MVIIEKYVCVIRIESISLPQHMPQWQMCEVPRLDSLRLCKECEHLLCERANRSWFNHLLLAVALARIAQVVHRHERIIGEDW